MRVYVVSFEPTDPEQGGVGGFDWLEYRADAEALYQSVVASDEGQESIWTLWSHDTEETDPVAITEELDTLWAEGWPPSDAQVLAKSVTDKEKVVEYLTSLTVWHLADLAGCVAPDSQTSSGALFLTDIRDAVVQDWNRLTENKDPNSDGAVYEIANGNVPTAIHDLWLTFTDLAAYREDIPKSETRESLSEAAMTALYQIGERLVLALVKEGKEHLE